MIQPLIAIVMAAGKGTRMKSDRPKVLHEIAGMPLLGHVLHRLDAVDLAGTYVIVGHGADLVRDMLPARCGKGAGTVQAVEQREQLGTGHAISQVAPHLDAFAGTVLILSGDVPLLKAETLIALFEAHSRENAGLSFLTTVLPDPTGYGRILRDESGRITEIAEHKDATAEQRLIREVNLGTYVCHWPSLRDALAELTPNNAQGEYYLTDAIALLVAAGRGVASHCTADPIEGAGINTRAELATLHDTYNRRTAAYWMAEGVTVLDPQNTVIGPRVRIGRDTVLEPGVRLLGGTTIGEHCLIGAFSQLNNMEVGDRVHVLHSYLVNSTIGHGTHVGPYAHIRMGTRLGENVRLGNFVEVKNSELGDGTKASHLAYLGDATVGRKVNIGCGVITCNYDGQRKHRTQIGDGSFIGSNSNLVAPVTIGEDVFVAAGSTITTDVPAGALAIGRGRQVIKEGWVALRRGTVAEGIT